MEWVFFFEGQLSCERRGLGEKWWFALFLSLEARGGWGYFGEICVGGIECARACEGIRFESAKVGSRWIIFMVRKRLGVGGLLGDFGGVFEMRISLYTEYEGKKKKNEKRSPASTHI